jgi:DNA-binding beta-propeller fold protein YncE
MSTNRRTVQFFVLLFIASAIAGPIRAQEVPGKPQYVFSFAFGSKGKGNGQFDTPMAVAIAPSGNIIVADTGNDRVQVFDRAGKFLSTFGSSFAILVAAQQDSGKGKFWFPRGVAVSSSGDIVVAESLNSRVQVFDSEGKFLRSFGNKGRGNGNLDDPSGVAIASSGNIVVADEKNYRIQIFSSSGKFLDQFGNQGVGDGQFYGIWDVAITSSQEFVVSDCVRIQVFDKSGNFRRKLGERPADSHTTGIAVTSSDHVVVAHMGKFSGVRVFDLEGTLLTEFGSKGQGNGQFNEPAGVAVDRSGSIFVADKGNHRVQVFKLVEKKSEGSSKLVERGES